MSLPQTLGDWKRVSDGRPVPVRDEMRRNLLRKLRSGETLFPGVLGYDDSVVCILPGHFASLPNSHGRPPMTLDPRGRAERRR